MIVAITSVVALLVIRTYNVQSQRQTVSRIRALGGQVDSDNFTYAPRWLKHFVYPKVRIIRLREAQLARTDAQQLAAFTSLERLDLTGTPIQSDDLQVLTALKNLQFLFLGKTGLGDADIRHVASLLRIKKLSLAETKVGDQGLSQLIGLTQLQELDIAGCPISDDGLKQLQSLPGLKVLELSDQQVTAASTKHLQGLSLNRIVVRVKQGGGRQQRDLLAGLGIADTAGVLDADGSIIWRTNQPWEQSLAGVCETVQQVLQLEARHADEFLAIVARSNTDWNRFFAAERRPTGRPQGDPTEIASFADFIAAVEGEVSNNDANLWAFARSDRAKLIIPDLLRRLQDPKLTDPGHRLRKFGTYILVHCGLHDENAVKLLAHMLHDDPDKTVRHRTVYAFGDFFGADRTDPAVRMPDATEARIAMELLLAASDDLDTETRAESVSVLGSLVRHYPEHAANVLPTVVARLADKEHWCRNNAIVAWDQVIRANPSAVQPHVAAVRKMINRSDDVEVTVSLIVALGSVRKANQEDANAAADLFLAYLWQPDWRLKNAATTAIGRLAQDNPEVTKRIILELLEKYTAEKDSRPPIEKVFAEIAKGVQRGHTS